jgi:predicted thioesterase
MYDVATLEPGISAVREELVDERLVTRHVGGAGLFATPAMIGLMEMTAHQSVEPHLPEGATTVGYEVHVRHLNPAEPGSRVVIETRLLEVRDGRKLLFEVRCRQGDTVIGEGTHRRTVVPARGPRGGHHTR